VREVDCQLIYSSPLATDFLYISFLLPELTATAALTSGYQRLISQGVSNLYETAN
jgi:hypothetical protein